MGQGAYIFGCEGLSLSPEERAFFRDSDPWGFILFARNVDTPEQLRSLTAALRDSVGRDAPVLIDQEGGRVQRMRAPHWREFLPPLEQVSRAGTQAAHSMYLRSRIISHELRAVGIDGNCAPCADIATPLTHPFLRNRCYGETADRVIEIATAVARGQLDGGVLPVMKHMPGHGRAVTDSHKELPRVDAPRDVLLDQDFATFRALKDLPMGMSAHIIYDAFDPESCATTSPLLTQLVRESIGFGGLLMTDDISMKALKGSMRDRSKASLAAGMDVILHCNGERDEMAEIASVAGQMGETAQNRANAALDMRISPEPVDIKALDAELEALLNGRVDG